MNIENFKLLDTNKEISLALVDSFNELSSEKSMFFDLELLEIQLMKYGVDLSDEIKDLFNKFISKRKTKSEIDFFSFILSAGIKHKYKHFNEKLKNLSSLYNIIIWIEKHTEFTTLKYIDEVFDSEIESFYKFILFYIFKKDNIEKIDEFSIKNIERLINSKKPAENSFTMFNLVFQYLKNIKLIIKIFMSISRDKDFLKLIAIQKQLSENKIIKELLSESTDDCIIFLLFVITFNPYIVIDDFKINIFNKGGTRDSYLFLKAILYRFEHYKLNQKSPYSLQIFFKYLFKEYSIKNIKKLVYIIPNNEIILFEPFIIFALNNNDKDLQLSLLLKIVKSKTNNKNFMIIYGLLNLIIKNLEQKDLKERATNILIGNFKNYLTSSEKFELNELKNFFMTINFFLIKIKLNKETREKLFKMNLKLFDKFIKENYDINPTLLTISKYYNIILNNYLKEYDSPKDISLFLNEIKEIINNDNQILSININKIEEIDPETLNFNFISNEIKEKLVTEFNKVNNKLTIYPTLEIDGVITSKSFFKLLIFLKLTLLYDLLYPLFNKLSQEKIKIKRDKDNIYILNKDDLLLSKFKTNDVKVNSKKFYYHFINKVYSLIIIIVFSLLGFRNIIDGVITNNNELLISGSSIIILSLLIDYFLFFFFRKFDKILFFELKLGKDDKIFYSNDNSILSVLKR